MDTSNLAVGGPVILGSLERDAIARVVKSHAGEIRACYERGLVKAPSLACIVKVKFVINGAGKIVQAQTVETTLHDAGVEACMVDRVKTWTMPQPKGGGIAIVTYPFKLLPAP